MKQCVSVEQLKEFSEIQISKLMSKVYDVHEEIISLNLRLDDYTQKMLLEEYAERLTIGEMLSLLKGVHGKIDISEHNHLHIGCTIGAPYPNKSEQFEPYCIYSSDRWVILEHTDEENKEYEDVYYCNSLWEAVRKELHS